MPTADARRYSFKYVNGHPRNTAPGCSRSSPSACSPTSPPATRCCFRADADHRAPHRGDLGAGRAGGGPAGSRTMALIGNGAQSEFQALAFTTCSASRAAGLRHRPGRDRQALAQPARRRFRSNRARSSAAEAARGADIVTTVTADKRNAMILTPTMMEPGMHLNAVGGDCPGKTELHRDVLRAATRVSSSSTSRRPASRARSSSCRRTSR